MYFRKTSIRLSAVVLYFRLLFSLYTRLFVVQHVINEAKFPNQVSKEIKALRNVSTKSKCQNKY